MGDNCKVPQSVREKLFVYGTLCDPGVRGRVFGRGVSGSPDRLCGYAKREMRIEGEIYPVLVPSDNDCVDGLVLDVSENELRSVDKYETGAYARVKASLESGNEAWVYTKSSA